MDLIGKLVSSWSFAAFAGGASIVGTVWLIVERIRSARAKVYLFECRQELLALQHLGVRNVKIDLNGKSSENLVRELALLLNKSDRNLDENDFLEKPILMFAEGCTIFDAKTLVGDGLRAADIAIGETSVELSSFKIPSKQGVLVEVIHDGKSLGGFNAMVRTQPTIRRRADVIRILPEYGILLLLSAFGAWFGLVADFNFGRFMDTYIVLAMSVIVWVFTNDLLAKRVITSAEKEWLRHTKKN